MPHNLLELNDLGLSTERKKFSKLLSIFSWDEWLTERLEQLFPKIDDHLDVANFFQISVVALANVQLQPIYIFHCRNKSEHSNYVQAFRFCAEVTRQEPKNERCLVLVTVWTSWKLAQKLSKNVGRGLILDFIRGAVYRYSLFDDIYLSRCDHELLRFMLVHTLLTVV